MDDDVPLLADAVEMFLTVHPVMDSSLRAYRSTLTRLEREIGPGETLAALTGNAGHLAVARFLRPGKVAPATFNRELTMVRTAVRYWQARGWLDDDPTAGLGGRPVPPDNTRSIPLPEIEALWARPGVTVRDRTLWRMLYETAARSHEILALNVEDLDQPNRRARVYRKGGATDWVFWQTGTARLLPRYLSGRTAGPLFLSHRPPKAPVALSDTCPTTGRARLSYRRAEEIFKTTTGWTLHRLRHAALTHDADRGTNTALLLARSGHASVRSLERYTRGVSLDAVARHLDTIDPERRGNRARR